ncbi:hypothetical protein KAT80_00280 [Candidatus Pacearchaeota archaeon]|nr:hypothetical protein [Candidatus Pacearchaeota archaeon]
MKKEIIIGLMFIFVLSFISANPPMPCAFYGEVTHPNQTFPNGHFITAKINDVVSGECKIIDEKYGYGGNTCIILSYQDNVNIKFYIGDEEIGEGLFKDKEVVKIDFEVDFIPETSGNYSNGVCEPELGECSFNILDCDSAITDICKGNGVCDFVIGETCLNAPEDCGVCEYCGDGVCNNAETCSTCSQDCGVCPSNNNGNGGNGGGGGGGSSSSSTATTQTTDDILNLNFETKNDSTKIDSNENQQTTSSGLTGGVIGFVKTGKGIGLIFGILIIVFGIGVIAIQKYKTKSPQNEK